MASTITVPTLAQIANYPYAIGAALVALATAAKADIDTSTVGVATTRRVRGVCTSNMSLSAFVGVTGGTAQDGVTCIAGDVVALVGQTTAADNGLYLVGAVLAGTAPLTRIPDCATGANIDQGTTFEVGFEGTKYGGTTWKSTATGVKVWGTDDPVFYPKHCKGTLTLSSGTYTLGSNEGLWLYSTTKSSVTGGFNTAGGTVTSTVGWRAAVASRTAGKVGTAAVTIIAIVAAGTINTADNSTFDYCITNF